MDTNFSISLNNKASRIEVYNENSYQSISIQLPYDSRDDNEDFLIKLVRELSKG